MGKGPGANVNRATSMSALFRCYHRSKKTMTSLLFVLGMHFHFSVVFVLQKQYKDSAETPFWCHLEWLLIVTQCLGLNLSHRMSQSVTSWNKIHISLTLDFTHSSFAFYRRQCRCSLHYHKLALVRVTQKPESLRGLSELSLMEWTADEWSKRKEKSKEGGPTLGCPIAILVREAIQTWIQPRAQP